MLLQNGDISNDVRTLQHNLVFIGQKYAAAYPGLVIAVDGNFGPQTENAVKLFQSGAGFPVTGIVDDQTWNAIDIIVRSWGEGPQNTPRSILSQPGWIDR